MCVPKKPRPPDDACRTCDDDDRTLEQPSRLFFFFREEEEEQEKKKKTTTTKKKKKTKKTKTKNAERFFFRLFVDIKNVIKNDVCENLSSFARKKIIRAMLKREKIWSKNRFEIDLRQNRFHPCLNTKRRKIDFFFLFYTFLLLLFEKLRVV